MVAASLLDVKVIREDFPILNRKVYGRSLVYLDNAATSQKPKKVIESIKEYYTNYNANVHRAIHRLGEEATEVYEEARKKVATFINARSPNEIVFTRNTTEAINLVAYAWASRKLSSNDEILLTEMEHHSNLIPWYIVAKYNGIRLKFLKLKDDYTLDLRLLEDDDLSNIKLISITHTSNVLGTINPIKKIVRWAHDKGALVVVDGAQSVPHQQVDVRELDIDFLAFSGHKMCGPTGIGVLYAKKELLEEMDPFIGGGETIKEVYLGHATYRDPPHRFEGGTPNIAGAVGLKAAVEYLTSVGMHKIRDHEVSLTKYAIEMVESVEGLRVYGPYDLKIKGGIVAFTIDRVHAHDVAAILDREGVAVRAGHHCTQPLHRKLGVQATVRASFYLYNTFEEIDMLVQALKKVKKIMG